MLGPCECGSGTREAVKCGEYPDHLNYRQFYKIVHHMDLMC